MIRYTSSVSWFRSVVIVVYVVFVGSVSFAVGQAVLDRFRCQWHGNFGLQYCIASKSISGHVLALFL